MRAEAAGAGRPWTADATPCLVCGLEIRCQPTGAARVIVDRCLVDVQEIAEDLFAVEPSLMLATGFTPYVGVRHGGPGRPARAAADGPRVIEAAWAMLDLSEHVLQEALDPLGMTSPSVPGEALDSSTT